MIETKIRPSSEEVLTTTQRLLTEAQALSTRVTLVQEVMIAVNSSLDIDQILQVVGKQTRWLLDFDHCSICLRLPDDSVQTTNLTPNQPSTPFGDGDLVKQAIETQQTQLIYEEMGSSFASQLIIPLVCANEILGTLNFAAKKSHAYTQDDLRIMYLLTSQLSSSIRNAQRFTEINQLNSELDKTVNELQATQQRRNELTSMIVHDLNTPISTMMGYTDMTLTLAEEFPLAPEQEAWLENVLAAGRRTTAMIRDLLDVHKFDAGEMNLIKEPCDLSRLLMTVTEIYTVQAKKEGKMFEVNIPAGLPTLHIDIQHISRVIDNLLSNAFKFTNREDKITLHVRSEPDVLQITIKDNGIGIDPIHHQTIFNKFVQVTDKKGLPLRAGSGLGLAFCRMTILAHGGNIWVESDLGEGSTFNFTLPLLA